MSEVIVPQKYPVDSTIKKVVSSKAFWILFCLMGFTIPIVKTYFRELPPDLPVYSVVPPFEFENQYGNKITTESLYGKVYIASFMFTSCPTTCPGMMNRVQKIQKRVRGIGQKIALLSFTVDPEVDTVDRLFKYSEKINVNPHIWWFLTGAREKLEETLVKGFKVPMSEKQPIEGFKVQTDLDDDVMELTMMDIAHSEKLVLVDQKGRIRGYYSPDQMSIDKLMIDVGLLVNRLSDNNQGV